MKMKIRVAIYIRVSTQEQATEGYSIHEQEDRLKKYAEAQGWIIHRVYSDPGYSGAKIDRPALNEMITDIKRGKIQKVLVYKLDRLSRRQRDTLYIIEDVLLPNNVDFVSMTEQLDTGSPLGRAMIGILATFAQLEREQIKERMQVGLDARAKDGYYHGGGFDPIGYNYVNGELVINDYEAMQVHKIYELYLDGMSVTSIVNFLQRKGYEKRYGKWTDSAVRSVLFSPIYKGVIVWKDEEYKGRHKALISEDMYERTQTMRAQRIVTDPRARSNPFKRTSLLGGLIWCGNCGARYFAKTNRIINGKAQRYYMCYSRSKSKGSMVRDPNCKNPNYNTQTLDVIILDEIRKLAVDKKHLGSVLNETVIQNPAVNIKILAERVEKINNQINKLIDLYQIGNIDFNVINDKIEKLNEEKTNIENEIDTLNESTPPMELTEVKSILKTVPDILDGGNEDDIKNVVHSLIDSIIIYDDELEIHWKFE